jgi:RNA-directed DNA polymerase
MPAPTYVLTTHGPCRHGKKSRTKTGALVGQLQYRPNATLLRTKAMKRKSNLYYRIISPENLQLAAKKARQGKGFQYGVKLFDRQPEANLIALRQSLADKTYRTSKYTTKLVYEPKEREVFRLPFYPDRITHHAIMNVLEQIFVSTFTSDTYSCIKKRGIHKASYNLRRALENKAATLFCLKVDIRKFYPTIDHDILKKLLRRKFKDQDLLWLLDEIIDSCPGVPIGNYLSQYFANFYMSYFDHWIKEQKGDKYYFRYADDLVILAPTKAELHQRLADIRRYMKDLLNLEVKNNYQIFPVAARGIDFVGYVHYHGHTRLRKTIKKNFARNRKKPKSVAAYMGWASKCDSNHLIKKLAA